MPIFVKVEKMQDMIKNETMTTEDRLQACLQFFSLLKILHIKHEARYKNKERKREK